MDPWLRVGHLAHFPASILGLCLTWAPTGMCACSHSLSSALVMFLAIQSFKEVHWFLSQLPLQNTAITLYLPLAMNDYWDSVPVGKTWGDLFPCLTLVNHTSTFRNHRSQSLEGSKGMWWHLCCFLLLCSAAWVSWVGWHIKTKGARAHQAEASDAEVHVPHCWDCSRTTGNMAFISIRTQWVIL